MASVKQNALAGLRESLTKAEAFLAAADGAPVGHNEGETTCAVFSPDRFATGGTWTDEQLSAVRMYVDTWIAEPLRASLASIDGARDFTNESYLDGLAGKGWH